MAGFSRPVCVTVPKVNLCDSIILPREAAIYYFDSTWNPVAAGAVRLP